MSSLHSFIINCPSEKTEVSFDKSQPVYKFTPRENTDSQYLEALCGFFNCHSILLIYHPSTHVCWKNPNAPWRGVNHYHVVTSLLYHERLGHYQPFKNVNEAYKLEFPGRYIPATAIGNVEGMARYLAAEPREVVGVWLGFERDGTFEDFVQKIDAIAGPKSMVQQLLPSPDIKETQETRAIRFLYDLIDKYYIRTPDEVIENFNRMQPAEHKEAFRLRCKGMFENWFATAKSISKQADRARTLNENLLQSCKAQKFFGESTMSITQSIIAIRDWCNKQGIAFDVFCNNIFQVLSRATDLPGKNKKNCICLLGGSNAGKTWLFRSITRNFKWSTHITTTCGTSSYNFALQDAPNSTLVCWEEPNIDTGNVNQLKSFLGGDETATHVKGKQDKIIKEVPILMSSNSVPWYNCTSEKVALQNRIHMYSVKSLDGTFWQKYGDINPHVWFFLLCCPVADLQNRSEITETHLINMGRDYLHEHGITNWDISEIFIPKKKNLKIAVETEPISDAASSGSTDNTEEEVVPETQPGELQTLLTPCGKGNSWETPRQAVKLPFRQRYKPYTQRRQTEQGEDSASNANRRGCQKITFPDSPIHYSNAPVKYSAKTSPINEDHGDNISDEQLLLVDESTN